MSHELDDVLSDYFRAEMPSRWPTAPMPVTPFPAKRQSVLRGSRFALAASVAVLVAGSFLLGSVFRGVSSPVAHKPHLDSATRIKTDIRFEQPRNGTTEIRIDVIEERPLAR